MSVFVPRHGSLNWATRPLVAGPEPLVVAIGKLPASVPGSNGMVVGLFSGTEISPVIATQAFPPLSRYWIFKSTGRLTGVFGTLPPV